MKGWHALHERPPFSYALNWDVSALVCSGDVVIAVNLQRIHDTLDGRLILIRIIGLREGQVGRVVILELNVHELVAGLLGSQGQLALYGELAAV